MILAWIFAAVCRSSLWGSWAWSVLILGEMSNSS